MKTNPTALLRSLFLALALAAVASSCTSPVGTGAAAGAGAGAVGGYLYDRHDKRDDGDPQQWDRERMSNVARGTAIGAGVGAGVGYLSGQAAQNRQPQGPNYFGGYPQQQPYPPANYR
jgi:hypothetical protein